MEKDIVAELLRKAGYLEYSDVTSFIDRSTSVEEVNNVIQTLLEKEIKWHRQEGSKVIPTINYREWENVFDLATRKCHNLGGVFQRPVLKPEMYGEKTLCPNCKKWVPLNSMDYELKICHRCRHEMSQNP